VIIRPADLEKDALAIVEGAKDFAERSPTKNLLGDSFVAAVSKIVTLPGFEVLLAEHEGQVVGGIGIYYYPYIWNEDIFAAEEMFWWTLQGAPFKTGKTLLEKAMIMIKEKEAVPMFKALSSNRKGFDKTYRGFGMEPVETLYMRCSYAD